MQVFHLVFLFKNEKMIKKKINRVGNMCAVVVYRNGKFILYIYCIKNACVCNLSQTINIQIHDYV